MIALKTGASANGRLLAQTAVSLQKNAVKRPKGPKVAVAFLSEVLNVREDNEVMEGWPNI
jgi:hypothetical protein